MAGGNHQQTSGLYAPVEEMNILLTVHIVTGSVYTWAEWPGR